VRQLRSAVSWYYTQDMSMRYPGQVMRDRFRLGMTMLFVSPTDEATTTLTASGMARRLGTEVKKSWALAHVHIVYVDQLSCLVAWSCLSVLEIRPLNGKRTRTNRSVLNESDANLFHSREGTFCVFLLLVRKSPVSDI
jgi:hypothetical protein